MEKFKMFLKYRGKKPESDQYDQYGKRVITDLLEFYFSFVTNFWLRVSENSYDEYGNEYDVYGLNYRSNRLL